MSLPRLSRRVLGLDAPWIDRLKTRADELREGGAEVISLGQAIPGFPPPASALRAAQSALSSPATHVYTADAGTIELRTAVAAWLSDLAGGATTAENLLITAGANQAFMLAVLTLVDPEDDVLLASPYFLNHETAVRAASAVPIEVAAAPEAGFTLTLEDLERAITPRTRAAVIVSPSNPTGAVTPAGELDRIARALLARDIALVVDETYLPFVYDARPFSATALSQYPNVIAVGSFSKAFAMTGWRLGYLAGPPDFIAEALKIQDAMVICAPAIAQAAVLGALREQPRYIEQFLPELRARREFLRARLAEVPAFEWLGAAGGFFAFVRVEGCADSLSLAMRLLDEAHVVTLPGRLFGSAGEGFLRLSYGATAAPEMARACDRIAEFLSRS
jgi:aspartate/methionine/tyrosine aminotransferase